MKKPFITFFCSTLLLASFNSCERKPAEPMVTSAEFETLLKEELKTTKSGLKYKILKEGKGESPKATDKVTVHYTGWTLDGKKFDSSVDRGAPATFPLDQVVSGWTEGVQLMKPGSKFKFIIPPELGYGKRASGPIPANATLIFEIELISIK